MEKNSCPETQNSDNPGQKNRWESTAVFIIFFNF